MLTCPHCEKPGITVMRKLCLGPAVPATCKSCGKKVGVPYTALYATIPVIAVVIISLSVESFAIKAALWAGGFLVMAIWHMRWVPLEKR